MILVYFIILLMNFHPIITAYDLHLFGRRGSRVHDFGDFGGPAHGLRGLGTYASKIKRNRRVGR
jgi:hypothetical protein